MHRQTKAVDIPQKVKDAVWERDNHCCILCHTNNAMPNAHYIPRSHGGLGIEENIVTLCMTCHHRYDNTPDRAWIKPVIADYLRSKYPNWENMKLIYSKWE